MKHKLVIYGNNMYKEVDFDDSFRLRFEKIAL